MDIKREVIEGNSQQSPQPQINHTMPTKPGDPVRVYVGQGVSEEAFAQYLVDNGLATYVVDDSCERLGYGIFGSDHRKAN
jgi:hypothetical protein